MTLGDMKVCVPDASTFPEGAARGKYDSPRGNKHSYSLATTAISALFIHFFKKHQTNNYFSNTISTIVELYMYISVKTRSLWPKQKRGNERRHAHQGDMTYFFMEHAPQ